MEGLKDIKRITVDDENAAIYYTTDSNIPLTIEELRLFMEFYDSLDGLLFEKDSFEMYTLEFVKREVDNEPENDFFFPFGVNVNSTVNFE